jgi:hypothetical protein
MQTIQMNVTIQTENGPERRQITIQRPSRQREQSREEVRTPPRNHRPPRREEVSRFYTASSVEYSVDGIVREIKWFTDIQMGYIWILDKIRQTSDIDEWDVRDFEEVADRLEERWYEGKDGLIVAKLDECKFRIYYNPEETEAIRNRTQRPTPNP